jgi:hypothetical protein
MGTAKSQSTRRPTRRNKSSASPQPFWLHVPSDESLKKREGWARIGSRFSAMRHQLLIVPEHSRRTVNGPVHRQISCPIDSTLELKEAISQVMTYTVGIQESIKSARTASSRCNGCRGVNRVT